MMFKDIQITLIFPIQYFEFNTTSINNQNKLSYNYNFFNEPLKGELRSVVSDVGVCKV